MSKKSRTGFNPLDDYLPQIRDSREEKPETEQAAEKPDKPARAAKKAQKNPQTFSQTFSQTKTFTDAQTFAENIKDKAGQGAAKPRRLEDDRKRQTYWMAPEEIKMINEISKKADMGKYQVVSAAVRLLYDYVFEDSLKK